ncbi:YchF/TatD family DNA exonuclease [Candidatus Magnetomonas plexicatena]|uniref:YchF/TatD family DNA exonuclease n=1 Tax=Candidatus Magnetomonas plexicatena TaxID=2552947 RepID=UPI001103BF75|nr:YchF/TatD family DNA exonuclease [Nitrospirales bacterium LBB_01]
MIDTHCHLEMPPFEGVVGEIVRKAAEAGVTHLITIGSDVGSNERNKAIAESYKDVFFTVGIHPHEAKYLSTAVYENLQVLCKHKKCVAIGETGLDYYHNHSPKDVQKRAFIKQIELAKETSLPLIIHSRDASEDTLRILTDHKVTQGVFHCFTANVETAKEVMLMGLHVSFSGTVTFKNNPEVEKVVNTVSDNHLLVETDAPYLAPVPHRGKRNEPAYVVHTAKKIAQLRGILLEDVDRITTLNAQTLFRLNTPSDEDKIAYQIRNTLYLNMTNSCTNRCTFCLRNVNTTVKGHNLSLKADPSSQDLIETIGDSPAKYDEVVFCGYGEPLLKLENVITVAKYIKAHGGSVRINTNGLGNIIHNRNILPELTGLADKISISLNAQDTETYNRLCVPTVENAYAGVIEFIKEAKKHIPDVTVTVVDASGVDIARCKEIAHELGVNFRLRHLDVLG